jgi:tetratricopeptide (TPR) repeat protein
MDINAQLRLALEQYKTGNLKQAEYIFKQILQMQPKNIDACNFLGIIYYQWRNYDDSIHYLKEAVNSDPTNAHSLSNLGTVLKEKGLLDDAIECYQKALRLSPNFAGAYNNLGSILQEKGKVDDAVECYQKALQLNSNFADAYYNLGTIFKERGQLNDAVTYYGKALQINSNFVQAFVNLGVIYQEKGQLDEAVSCYQKALQIDPNYAEAHFDMSVAFLLAGNFKQGFKEYEWRWKTKNFLDITCSRQPSDFSTPLWDGSSLEEKSILIFAEQGVGDEIMFASCLPDIINQASLCIIECDKRLTPIFSRSFPKAVLVERANDFNFNSFQLPQTDTVTPIGSLPKSLRTDFDAFPQKSYLIPDFNRVQMWRTRLRRLGEGLTVGISWRGGKLSKVRRIRSIMLPQWAQLFSLSEVHFINLQYGDCKIELKELEEKLGVTIHDCWEDATPLKDLDNFAAQIAALDLIVSVDNATVHMAGALGKPVWILLPFVPDWRWMLNRADSPWYPTMRLFRQPAPGDWESVISKVKEELLRLLVER